MNLVVVVLVLFPLLLLIHVRLAIVSLLAAIVWMTISRLRPTRRRGPSKGRPEESQYQAGYEN